MRQFIWAVVLLFCVATSMADEGNNSTEPGDGKDKRSLMSWYQKDQSDDDSDSDSDSDESTTRVFRCRRKSNGWYNHGRCRNVYYRCWNHRSFEHHCPHHHVYHHRNHRCVPKLTVRECRHHRHHHHKSDSSESYDRSYKSRSYESQSRSQSDESYSNSEERRRLRIQVRRKSSEGDRSFETVNVFHCRDQSNGWYAHGHCHNHYFRCWNQQSYRHHCPRHHIFHHSFRRCVPRLTVKECRHHRHNSHSQSQSQSHGY